ncbi:MAG: signal peptidase II [Jatrophihabitans sp.]
MTFVPSSDPSAEMPAEPAEQRSGRPLLPVFFGVALVVLAADAASKVAVVSNVENKAAVRWLGGAIYLDVARNSGAAFSLGTGMTVVLTIVALAVVGVIVRVASRLRSLGWAIALGLILGGALGNLTDRLLRAPGVGRGHVVDWISVFGPGGEHYPIFNLADSGIVCGGILAVLLVLLGIDIEGRRSAKNEPSKSQSDG